MKKFLMTTALTLAFAAPAMANGGTATTDAKKADAWFSKIDTDGDGKISKEEHDTFSDNMFTQMDTNGDGFISKDEMKAAKMMHHGDMGSGKTNK